MDFFRNTNANGWQFIRDHNLTSYIKKVDFDNLKWFEIFLISKDIKIINLGSEMV